MEDELFLQRLHALPYQEALKLYENMLTIFHSVTDQSEISLKRSIAITQVNQARNLSWLGNEAMMSIASAKELVSEQPTVAFYLVK